MVFLKSKSKFDKSTCHKEGCNESWIKDAEYIYDTDGRNAYCLKHDEINSKVTQNKPRQGGGGWTKPVQQLWREPKEAVEAMDIFHGKVIPQIFETVAKSAKLAMKADQLGTPAYVAEYTKHLEFYSVLYTEVFLGKFKGIKTS